MVDLADILARWEEVDARARDSAVAKHVMGWKTYRTSNAGVVRMTPEDAADWGRGDSVECEVSPNDDVSLIDNYVPDYTTDASEDYAVLEKLRSWDDAYGDRLRRNVHQKLMEIWHGRKHLNGSSFGSDIALRYRPGDYSHASLAALTALQAGVGRGER